VTILGSNPPEVWTFPLEQHTKVLELKYMVAGKLGIDPQGFSFVVKAGVTYKTLQNHEEIQTKMTVRGINSWIREKTQYPHPICLIGAGHNGLRQALSFQKEGINNYVCFDRLNQIGGCAWVLNANPTSKLQTELGVYHLQYDPDYAIPRHMKTWPTRADLLVHFKEVCDEFGMTAHIQLNTAVTEMSVVVNDKSWPYWVPHKQHYNCITKKMDSEEESETTFSAIAMYPGALIKPTRVEFKGEEAFEGQIGYGMFSEFDYTQVEGDNVAVLGMGAFAVENIRTCLEHKAKKAFLVCRRKNIAMPRVISWFINQSLYPPTAVQCLNGSKPMYDMIPDDPWTYYAVNANKDRTTCTIRQKARFGIGDVFFLACYYGKAQMVVDQVKRMKFKKIVLEGGDSIEVSHVVKVLGFGPDATVEKIMGIKEMCGFFVNADYRRWISSEPPGVDAGKFGGTSLSPGAIQNAEGYSYILNYPKDVYPLIDGGMWPRQKVDKIDYTSYKAGAYIWDPRQLGNIGMILGSGVIPALGEIAASYGPLNRRKQLEAHPLEEFVDECADEWLKYCESFKEQGDDRPFPPYPYTKDYVREMVKANDEEGEADAIRQAQRAAGK